MARAKRNGGISQRASGSWEIRYIVGVGEKGKAKRVTETIRGSRRTAEKAPRSRLGDVENRRYVDKSKDTLSSLMREFMEGYARIKCSPRTQSGYQGQISRYIDPFIGDIPYQSLSATQVEKLYGDMASRGLSNQTIKHLHRLLREALGWAVKRKLLSENPTDVVDAPTVENKELPMWDLPTIHTFLGICDESKFGDFFKVAIYTGMRRSEVCGLTWDSVDLLAGQLRVSQTIHYINGVGLVTGSPKTERSRRTIPLAEDVIDLLHAIKGRLIERELPSTGEAYVFSRPNGLPLLPSEVTKEFTRLIREHSLPHLSLHGLRHAFATLGLMAGINPKIVSEALGHSTVGITLDTYSHILPNMKEEHINLIARLLKGEA